MKDMTQQIKAYRQTFKALRSKPFAVVRDGKDFSPGMATRITTLNHYKGDGHSTTYVRNDAIEPAQFGGFHNVEKALVESHKHFAEQSAVSLGRDDLKHRFTDKDYKS